MITGILFAILWFSSSGFWFVLACLAGIVIGAVLFFKGFGMLRYKRMILDTPLSKIHSASIGLVEVMGTATGPKTLTAPVTGEPCFYYRVRAWQWYESGDKHEWRQVIDESVYLPFFLEDNTGRVLVDAQGAEMDVHKSFSDELGTSIFRSRELLPPNVLNFLVKRGLAGYGKIKLEERIIQPGYPLFVFGTLGENPASGSWVPRPLLADDGASTYNLQLGDGRQFGVAFRNTSTATQPELLDATLVNALGRIPGIQIQRTEMRIPAGGGQAVLPGNAAALMNRADARFAAGVLTNSPASVSVVDETASEKPGDPSFDLHPSAAISKGERKDPFTISYRSQKEVVQSLAWKSALCIWGGPLLAIVSFYYLMLCWGLFSLGY